MRLAFALLSMVLAHASLAGLRDVDFDPRMGAQLPLNLGFREGGSTVRLDRYFGNRFGRDFKIDSIAAKIRSVLRKNTPFRGEENLFEVFCHQRLASHAHRKSTDKLRFHAVVDDVP